MEFSIQYSADITGFKTINMPLYQRIQADPQVRI